MKHVPMRPLSGVNITNVLRAICLLETIRPEMFNMNFYMSTPNKEGEICGCISGHITWAFADTLTRHAAVYMSHRHAANFATEFLGLDVDRANALFVPDNRSNYTLEVAIDTLRHLISTGGKVEWPDQRVQEPVAA